jgi:ATP-dependent RNA helicase DOB1
MRIKSFPLSAIAQISAVRMGLPSDLHPAKPREKVGKSIKEVHRRFADSGVPLLDPVNDMKIKSGDFTKLMQRTEKLSAALEAHEINKLPEAERSERLREYQEKQDLAEKGRFMRRKAKAATAMVMKDDLRKMKKVLKHVEHVDDHGVIHLKGRTACEINTANELVATEVSARAPPLVISSFALARAPPPATLLLHPPVHHLLLPFSCTRPRTTSC